MSAAIGSLLVGAGGLLPLHGLHFTNPVLLAAVAFGPLLLLAVVAVVDRHRDRGAPGPRGGGETDGGGDTPRHPRHPRRRTL